MVWIDYDDGHAGGYPHECNRCPARSGPLTCDLPRGHDSGHYNDRVGAAFRA